MVRLELSKGVERGREARVELRTRRPQGRVVEIFFWSWSVQDAIPRCRRQLSQVR